MPGLSRRDMQSESASSAPACGKVRDLLASSTGLRHCHRVPDTQGLHDTGIDRLSDSVTELSQQVAVLRDILDEIREEVSWAVRNDRVLVATVPVLKRMAVDPTTDDWGKQLVIQRGSAEPDDTDVHRAVIRELLARAGVDLNSIEDAAREMNDRARELSEAEPERGSDGLSAERQPEPPPERTAAHGGRLF